MSHALKLGLRRPITGCTGGLGGPLGDILLLWPRAHIQSALFELPAAQLMQIDELPQKLRSKISFSIGFR